MNLMSIFKKNDISDLILGMKFSADEYTRLYPNIL